MKRYLYLNEIPIRKQLKYGDDNPLYTPDNNYQHWIPNPGIENGDLYDYAENIRGKWFWKKKNEEGYVDEQGNNIMYPYAATFNWKYAPTILRSEDPYWKIINSGSIDEKFKKVLATTYDNANDDMIWRNKSSFDKLYNLYKYVNYPNIHSEWEATSRHSKTRPHYIYNLFGRDDIYAKTMPNLIAELAHPVQRIHGNTSALNDFASITINPRTKKYSIYNGDYYPLGRDHNHYYYPDKMEGETHRYIEPALLDYLKGENDLNYYIQKAVKYNKEDIENKNYDAGYNYSEAKERIKKFKKDRGILFNGGSIRPKAKYGIPPYKIWHKMMQHNGYNMDSSIYDYETYYKENPEEAEYLLTHPFSKHLSDKYKRPNHPTFSVESMNSNARTPGGYWTNQRGIDIFNHSPFTYRHWLRTANELGKGYNRGEPLTIAKYNNEYILPTITIKSNY